jgi:hypothetical protein
VVSPAAVAGRETLAGSEVPGRSCPVHYRYRPAVFRGPASPGLDDCEVLYVVGGLYGNEPALERVLELFERERGRKRLVFNGDFHWFDADPEVFARVQRTVLAFDAIRGNVETEIADESSAGAAGCGCGYPEWVGDEVVERSNRILERLRLASTPAQRRQLAALPMWLRADVGGARVAIVHGDAESLAGWGFAQEHLSDASHRRRVRDWFADAQVDAFACTHTCLPVFLTLRDPARESPPLVLNNGAAGMPNFAGDAAGLLTRIAVRPFEGPQRRFGVARAGLFADAIAIEHDRVRWHDAFVRQWPEGSDAFASYWSRIARGPAYDARQAVVEAD